MILISLFVFIIGLVFGSFFNVLIYRLPRKESISFPPSHCTHCNSAIKWYDNIPVLSFIFLRGRCRKCKNKISIQYPIIEVITGIMFMAIFIKESFTLFSVVYIVFFSSLLIVSVIDIKTKEINLIHLILPGITLMTGLLLQEFKVISPDLLGTPYVALKTALFGAAVGGLFIFLVRFFGGRILKQEAMGEGDIYIAILMGLAVGYRILFYAMIFAGVFGLIAFIAIPIIKKDKEIPFAPFLSMGLFTVFMLEEIFRRFNLI